MITLTIVIISVISIILTAIFNSEMDTIMEFQRVYYKELNRIIRTGKSYKQSDLINSVYSMVKRKPWFKIPFWLLRVKWKNLFQKTIMAFIGDGWHLTKALRIYFMLIPVTIIILLYFNIQWHYAFIFNLITFGFHGLWFELFYGE